MAWISWKKLALPKCNGGLGFRDVKEFNDSLLAKLSWRILNNPDSLISRVMLGNYCFNSPFLDCEAKGNMSHGWRGILAGKEVLKKGMGWIIGDGESIKVWKDAWLSTSKPVTPYGPPTNQNTNLKVSDLLTNSNCWNLPMIREHLPHYEEMIRQLHPSTLKPRDRMVWLPEPMGKFTTKSGYKSLKEEEIDLRSREFNWNGNIWSLHTSPKIKPFLWRATIETTSRGFGEDLRCKKCSQIETTFHVIRSCPFAREVWNQAQIVGDPHSTTTMFKFLESIKLAKSLPPLGISSTPLFSWIVWKLWTTRNLYLFENREISARETITNAIKEAREWQEANIQPNVLIKRSNVSTPMHKEDCFSCFIDGAWRTESRQGGMGWLIQDTRGSTIFQGSKALNFIPSALMAETIALRAALTKAASEQIKDLQVFSDCEVLINTLNSGLELNEITGILFGIRNLVSRFSSLSFIYISRSLNFEAHTLAKAALCTLNPCLDTNN